MILKENPSALMAFRFLRNTLRRRKESTVIVIDTSEIQQPTGRPLRGTYPAPDRSWQLCYPEKVARATDFPRNCRGSADSGTPMSAATAEFSEYPGGQVTVADPNLPV